MKYDFRKVRVAIALKGHTLCDVEKLTGLSNQTISRVLKYGKAHPATALRLVNAFDMTMADIKPRHSAPLRVMKETKKSA